MVKYKIPLTEMPFVEAAPAVRHKIHDRDGRRLRLVEYDQSMVPHWCERGHVGQILDGQMEIEFATGTVSFGPGDGVDIPSGEMHRHRARILSKRVLALFVEDTD